MCYLWMESRRRVRRGNEHEREREEEVKRRGRESGGSERWRDNEGQVREERKRVQ